MSEHVHEFSQAIAAPPEKVFEALTQAEHLTRWFAEHVEIELEPGAPFRFWGRHSYDAPTPDAASQMLTTIKAPTTLGFSWRIDGEPSEVLLTVAADEAEENQGGAKLAVRHSFARLPATARAKHLIDDLWRLHCANLKAYLEGGEGMLLPDFTDPKPEIRQSILIDAPRAAVFRALMEPDLLAKWMWANAPVVEPKAGGAYRYGWSYEMEGRQVLGGPTKIIELVANEKLVTDWPDWRGDPSVPVQTVTWFLEDEGDGTRVTVIHSGFVRAADFSDFPFGWTGFLQGLKSTVEAL